MAAQDAEERRLWREAIRADETAMAAAADEYESNDVDEEDEQPLSQAEFWQWFDRNPEPVEEEGWIREEV